MIVVCAIDRPRSAIISTKSRRLSLNRRYQRTHRMMISRSKWRPSNSSATAFSLPIGDPQPAQHANVVDRAPPFAPEPEILALEDNFVERLAGDEYDLAIRDRWSLR